MLEGVIDATNLFEKNDPNDDRETKPEQVLDCLTGFVERGEVQDLIVLVETKDNDIYLWSSDMRRTEVVGLLEYAKIGFAHREQHEGGEEDE